LLARSSASLPKKKQERREGKWRAGNPAPSSGCLTAYTFENGTSTSLASSNLHRPHVHFCSSLEGVLTSWATNICSSLLAVPRILGQEVFVFLKESTRRCLRVARFSPDQPREENQAPETVECPVCCGHLPLVPPPLESFQTEQQPTQRRKISLSLCLTVLARLQMARKPQQGCRRSRVGLNAHAYFCVGGCTKTRL
jgi:hypothetical protein